MGSQFRGYYGPVNGIKVNNETLSELSDQNLVKGFKPVDKFFYQNSADIPFILPDPGNLALPSSANFEVDLHEDCDFSDVVLKYINQILMEEDMEEKTCMFQESLALQVTEKSLYEVIREKYPHEPNHCQALFVEQNLENPDENYTTCNHRSSNLMDSGWNCELGEYKYPYVASEFTSQSSLSFSDSGGNIIDGFVDSLASTLRVPDMFTDSGSIVKFGSGVKEASKLPLNDNCLLVDVENNGFLAQEPNEEAKDVLVKVEKKLESEHVMDGLRGKKNSHPEDVDLEEQRSIKQSAVYTDPTVRSKMFDFVLLSNGCENQSALRKALQNGMSKNNQLKGSNGGKGAHGKKKGVKKDVVDLSTLLSLCAQAVSANDQKGANELLEQIRQHSSVMGNGVQRMAHYFANGLEARLAGSGTQIYNAYLNRLTSAADTLKAYHLLLAVCPFKKFSNFFSNKTIMQVAEKATRLHVIHFGILYGFEWPALIERLSTRLGGPPKLRITGIDFPQPGFRPAARVEETGRRLANYAETFNVPFEFNAIAQKWETIQIEDLNIQEGEVLVVNSMFRLKNLLDETVVMARSPRNIVLNLIKKINPDIFIHGIMNGAYSSPFFIPRFRQALFHFSTLFDMLEAVLPRESPERMLMEREIYGREAMNAIACEDSERIERPETYQQWQVRTSRAGFNQLPLNEEIMRMAKDRLKSYHRDYLVDEDGQWMLLGWKGRISYAISTWKPAY